MKRFAFLSLMLLSIVYSLNSQIPDDGLAAYYPFNGNANDESSNANDGTVNGAILTADRFGNSNSAYEFDGNDWIEVAHAASIDFDITDSYSLSLWVKVSSDMTGGDVISKWVNSFNPYPYGITISSLQSSLRYISGQRYIGGLPQDTTRNQVVVLKDTVLFSDSSLFQHIAVVFQPEKISLYIDGVLVNSSINYMVSGNVSSQSNLYIGRRAGREDRYYHGVLDDIRIYSRSLEDIEVAALYNEGKCIETVYDTITTEVFDTTFVNVYDTTYVEVYDTTFVTEYDTILTAVTDTLVIDVALTDVSPPDNYNTLKIYPNPAREYITINTGNYSNMQDYSIKIINMAGTTVFETPIQQPVYEINLSTWTGKGVYLVKIFDKTNQEISVKKIVLQ